MCDRCRHRAATVLALMLGSIEGSQCVDDSKAILDILIPGIPDDAPEFNADNMATLMTGMSIERIGEVARFCGFTSAALDEVNSIAIKTIHAMAKVGHAEAIAWLAENGGKIRDLNEPEGAPPQELLDLLSGLNGGLGGVMVVSIGPKKPADAPMGVH